MKKEHLLLSAIFLLLMINAGFGYEFVTSEKADLNGDGKDEQIRLDPKGRGFTLYINDVSIHGSIGADDIYIVDIDENDQYKEVAVHSYGPSDDDQYQYFWFDGKEIKDMGGFERWPKYTGYGIIYVREPVTFWERTKKYVLNKETRTLDFIPQEFYFVRNYCPSEKPDKSKVKKSFPIFFSRTDDTIVANIKEGSMVSILIGDTTAEKWEDAWYLIKSETGILGWAQEGTFWKKVELCRPD